MYAKLINPQQYARDVIKTYERASDLVTGTQKMDAQNTALILMAHWKQNCSCSLSA
jgi:hypothetical protein